MAVTGGSEISGVGGLGVGVGNGAVGMVEAGGGEAILPGAVDAAGGGAEVGGVDATGAEVDRPAD